MAGAASFDGDVVIRGGLVVTGPMNIPAGAVNNDDVLAGAGIEASKLQHQYARGWAQLIGADAVSEARVIHVVRGATGTLLAFRAGAVTPAGAATTVTVDLKKNGTTMLTAVITLNNAQAAYEEVSATLSVTALAAGDVLSVHLVLAGTNEPQGVYCQADLREDAD